MGSDRNADANCVARLVAAEEGQKRGCEQKRAGAVGPISSAAMPFPRRYLHDDEEIVVDLKPHLWFLIPDLFLELVLVAIGVVAAQLINPGNGNTNGWINWAAALLGIVGLLRFLWTFLKWFNTHFVVTTDRLIYRSGILAKTGKEIPLERINDIAFNQTIFERMVGAGDLLIESGGEQGQQRFTNVRKPFDVQNEIYRQIERSSARDMDRMAGRRQLSIPEQIEKLDDLRQKGVISQAEFDAKKAQLLDQI
jgi:uncharacterized membrane protein YdbT with pleckstrin-like domain